MSTPLDKHGYVMSESDPRGRYRLIIGFATLDDLQDAYEYVAKLGRDFTQETSVSHSADVSNFGAHQDLCRGHG